MFAKDFFKDRLILFLGLLVFVSSLLSALFILIRLDTSQFKIVFRHWLIDGNSQFHTTSPSDFYSFVVLALLAGFAAWIIGYKVYDSFKPAAYLTFFLTEVVLVANFLISSSLLRL